MGDGQDCTTQTQAGETARRLGVLAKIVVEWCIAMRLNGDLLPTTAPDKITDIAWQWLADEMGESTVPTWAREVFADEMADVIEGAEKAQRRGQAIMRRMAAEDPDRFGEGSPWHAPADP